MKKTLKNLLPKQLIYAYSNIKNKNKTTEEIFTQIYQKKYWGTSENGETYFSGSGSVNKGVDDYKKALKEFIKTKEITSVFEIGCGDFSIMKPVLEQSELNYIGADVVKDLINHLTSHHGNDRIKFMQMDAITASDYPSADLCIIRQVLQHLDNAQILEILKKTNKFKFVIITEHIPLYPEVKNADKSISGYIRLQNKKTSGVFLNEHPFLLNSNTLLSYREDDADYNGKIIPALMLTSLIENIAIE